MIDRSILSKAYFTRDKIAQHHLNSFNDFLNFGLQKVINEQRIIETDVEDTYIKLGNIKIGRPVVHEADGSVNILYPNEARLRNLTYSAPMNLEMTIVQDGVDKEPDIVDIGLMPIMLLSNKCNLFGLSASEKIEKGEDPLDPGGYFIIGGTERVLMTLEDLAPNRILVEYGEKYGSKTEVAKVFSYRRGYRALILVERGRDSILEVSIPSVPKPLNFITLLRALGLETDEEIVNAVSSDPEIVKYMIENIEYSMEHTENDADTAHSSPKSASIAMKKIGSTKAGGNGYHSKRMSYVIDRYLLPHLGQEPEDRLKKAHFLARMAERCFELALEKRKPDDKDHYANKRLKLAGDLMEDLFRVSFTRLTKDIKYQLERANMRRRELNIKTIVRADVLTDRILHPMATGNWVGGRTGVSQLLDRTDYIATISHLRRVISPLSRTQPHFEARDLHPTQWGRVCPSETPEGANCGLVKNFAQLVELSTGTTEEEQIKNLLYELGVKKVLGFEYFRPNT
ncbi:MAG: DNA-directed RNA polymerase subunit B'' [Methanosarcinales archaeon]